MSTTAFAITLAAVVIIVIGVALVAASGKLMWRGLLENALRRKPRWRIEEMRCDKCANSDKPGYRRYQSFNPATEEVEVSLLSCDKCIGTPGYLTIAVIPDDLQGEKLTEVLDEIEAEAIGPDRTRIESEVREDSE